MKIISAILAALLPLAAAGEAIHEKYLSEPYPQQGDIICINPVPLKVPLSMMQTEFMQFQMSMDSHFEDSTVITSEPAAWNIFNAHKELAPGTWHWRFRGVSADGETLPWSGTFTFSIAEDVPVFVTPAYDVFRKNISAEQILTSSPSFIQIHQSYIININYLIMIRDKKCVFYPPFDHIRDLQVSKLYLKKLQDKFLML